eukprot:269487-Chlamydomonas_euryale.AAC.1
MPLPPTPDIHAPLLGSQNVGAASAPRVSTHECGAPARVRPTTTQASSPNPSSRPHSSSEASSCTDGVGRAWGRVWRAWGRRRRGGFA